MSDNQNRIIADFNQNDDQDIEVPNGYDWRERWPLQKDNPLIAYINPYGIIFYK